MKELNGIIIDGRTVAVDFALPKDQWEDVQGESEEEDMLKRKREDAELEREEHEDPSEVEAETIDSSEHSDEEMLSNGDKTPQTEKQNKSYDDCTLFVRNLLFETTEDELSHHFSKFGRLRYAKIVIDPRMNKPRGTGFICFLRPEDAKELLCLASKVPRVNAIGDSIMDPQDPDGIANQFRLNGRVLLVSKAVKREEAEKLKDDFVIAIPSNHPLAQVLSTTDLQVRSQSLKQRRSLLVKNPTLHLSLTRLSVRNIPRHITSTDLKALGRNSVVQFATEVKSQKRAPLTVEEKRRGRVIQKEKKGIIKQAKIVTEDNGRSRGYGFIEFTSHRHALMGLRWLNAREIAVSDSSEENPDRTDRKRRLIVEFAIENAQVVKRRAEREQKARDNATSSKFAEITKQKKRKREEEDIQDNLEQDTKR
ncbi:putative RNA-binding protein, partial [Neolecta irregularis DAH-3]